jgi:hypothetical protein
MSLVPSSCLHCERAPAVNRWGLCRACHAQPCIRTLYRRRRHDWTPQWERHLRRLTQRAQQGLPLFEDDGFL